MRRLLLLLLFCGLSIAVFPQVKSGAYRLMLDGLLDHTVPEMSVKTAREQVSSLVLLDAREPREYEVSHLPGAHPVGYDHFDLSHLPPDLPKDTPILVYCSVGYRSEKVSEKLIKAGYTKVSNLYGGIFEWVNQGNTVVDQNGPTPQVHAYNRTWGVWLKQGKKVYR